MNTDNKKIVFNYVDDSDYPSEVIKAACACIGRAPKGERPKMRVRKNYPVNNTNNISNR